MLHFEFKSRRLPCALMGCLLIAFLTTTKLSAQDSGPELKAERSSDKHKYGFVDAATRKLVLPYKYDGAYDFYKGLAVVWKKGKYGIINTKGEEVYPLKCAEIRTVEKNDHFIVNMSTSSTTGVIDFNLRTVVPFEFFSIEPIGNIYIVCKEANYNFTYGIYNNKGECVVAPDVKGRFVDNKAGYVTALDDEKCGLIKTTGELVVPFRNRSVGLYRQQNLIAITVTQQHCYFCDTLGKRIIDDEFEYYKSPVAGIIPVRQNGKWGFIKNGILIPCLYDEQDKPDFSDGTFILSKDKKFGVTDEKGNEVIACTWDKVSRFSQAYFVVSKAGKSGILDKFGKTVVPCSFDEIPQQQADGGFVIQDSDKKFGGFDTEGKQVVPFVLDENYVKTSNKTAAAYLAKLLEFDPKNPGLVYLDALRIYTGFKAADALPLITRHIEKYGNNIQSPHPLLYIRAKIYTDLNNVQAAADDAMWANTSQWGSMAYVYMGDRKFREQDFKAAEHYYHYASLYVKNPEAETLRNSAIAELKKRGQWTDQKLELGVTKPYIPDLKLAINNFTAEDKMEYAGQYSFKKLFTWDEAVKGCPQGYRMPELEDWTDLIDFIMKDNRISSSAGFLVREYIGNGWQSTGSRTTGPVTKNYVYRSEDKYGLNISPLRSESYINDMPDYMKELDIKEYWFVPGRYKGRMVNVIRFSTEGFEFEYTESKDAKECVRYIKK